MEEDRGLFRSWLGLLQQQLAFWIRAADLSLFTYSPLEQEVEAHLNPAQHTVGHRAEQLTGQLTRFDLFLCSGPLGLPPISSGITHNLSVSALWPSAPQSASTPRLKNTHSLSQTRSNTEQASHTASCKHNLSHTAM